jgi:hypothetical protein
MHERENVLRRGAIFFSWSVGSGRRRDGSQPLRHGFELGVVELVEVVFHAPDEEAFPVGKMRLIQQEVWRLLNERR